MDINREHKKSRNHKIVAGVLIIVFIVCIVLSLTRLVEKRQVSFTVADDEKTGEIQTDKEVLEDSPVYQDTEEIEIVIPKLFEDDSELSESLLALAQENEDVREILLNADDYPDEVLGLLAYAENNEDLIDFIKGYPKGKGKVLGGLTSKELSEDFPLFLQYDKRWGYYDYGDSMIAFCGCAPTAVSMVAVALTGNKELTPDVVADYAMERHLYVEGAGTDWSFFSNYCSEFGIQGKILLISEQNMINALEKGHPIIISVGPGDFTNNGHIVVITGYENGKFKINDPASRERSKKLWSFERLAPQIKNLWEFRAL